MRGFGDNARGLRQDAAKVRLFFPCCKRCCAIIAAASAPKSTGREYFNYGWLERHLTAFTGADARDVRATRWRADGGAHRPTGAAQWRLRAADGLWRRRSESVEVMAVWRRCCPVSRFSTTDKAGISGGVIWKRRCVKRGERSRACREDCSFRDGGCKPVF